MEAIVTSLPDACQLKAFPAMISNARDAKSAITAKNTLIKSSSFFKLCGTAFGNNQRESIVEYLITYWLA